MTHSKVENLWLSHPLAVLIASVPVLASNIQFVPKPNHGAIERIADLASNGDGLMPVSSKDDRDATAVWFTKIPQRPSCRR
jgi:hypothetical protein